ncbi:MAG: ABC transporter permease [Capsulimonas sp.]|jgi:phospholipid/cholesterol/gamma-HCH transport system permease protein|uniref:MlaE family ABC transporter permease n=1 Tax=Capsulimonas sp. TaxID=2494211 RepID=UPI0032645C77|nr:mlaE [Capsulimonas sp.]
MADQATTAPADVDSTRAKSANLFEVVLGYIGELAILLGQTVTALVQGRVNSRDLIQQMAFLGVHSVSIALLTSFASGAVIALYFSQFLNTYGVGSLVGAVVSLAISRELAPVLTGVVVAARAGSAIAAEIGTMKVTEQIDALRALAVSPIEYLVVPRVLASLIMLPAVCALADAAGIVGGYMVAVYMEGIPAATFPSSILQFLEPSDFYLGMVKTVVFGLIIALVGCHQGLRTRGGATEVGQATTNSVVLSIVLIYLSNFFLAAMMFTKSSGI